MPILYTGGACPDSIIIAGGWGEGTGFMKQINMVDLNYFMKSVSKYS